MSDTPRTDAQEKLVRGPNAWDPKQTTAVHSIFARELERENTALREDKARLDWMAARGMKWLGGNALTRDQIDAARKANP